MLILDLDQKVDFSILVKCHWNFENFALTLSREFWDSLSFEKFPTLRFFTLRFFILYVPVIACFIECYNTSKLSYHFLRTFEFVGSFSILSLYYVFFLHLLTSSKFFTLICFLLYVSLHPKIKISSSHLHAQLLSYNSVYLLRIHALDCFPCTRWLYLIVCLLIWTFTGRE